MRKRSVHDDETAARWSSGINLVNCLDCFDEKAARLALETAWKNPYTTCEMIDMYAAAGFDILRVLVTWGLIWDRAWIGGQIGMDGPCEGEHRLDSGCRNNHDPKRASWLWVDAQ